jgi:hypothetical protein
MVEIAVDLAKRLGRSIATPREACNVSLAFQCKISEKLKANTKFHTKTDDLLNTHKPHLFAIGNDQNISYYSFFFKMK